MCYVEEIGMNYYKVKTQGNSDKESSRNRFLISQLSNDLLFALSMAHSKYKNADNKKENKKSLLSFLFPKKIETEFNVGLIKAKLEFYNESNIKSHEYDKKFK